MFSGIEAIERDMNAEGSHWRLPYQAHAYDWAARLKAERERVEDRVSDMADNARIRQLEIDSLHSERERLEPFLKAAMEYTKALIENEPDLVNDDGVSYTRMLAAAYRKLVEE